MLVCRMYVCCGRPEQHVKSLVKVSRDTCNCLTRPRTCSSSCQLYYVAVWGFAPCAGVCARVCVLCVCVASMHACVVLLGQVRLRPFPA